MTTMQDNAQRPSAPLLGVIVALLGCSPSLAADFNKAHPHRGIVKPFSSTPPTIPLNAKEKQLFESGKPVFLVDAPVEKVWSIINDFDNYPDYVKEVKSTKSYSKSKNREKVYFQLKAVGVKIEYFIDHKTDDKKHYMTWTLDYDRESDVGDSVGFWKLDKVGDKTKVVYSADLKTKGWVPGFIRSLLVDNGLNTATQWLKKESEKQARASAE